MNKREAAQLAKSVTRECIGFRVRLLNRVITNIFDRSLQPLNISLAQGNILMMLALYGKASPKEISKILLMDKSTVSRNLERMSEKGWIDIVSEGRYQPQVVAVTADGRKLLKEAHGAWKKAQKEAALLLGDDGVAAVHKLHEAIRQKKPRKT
jgi:DNA-binding MarR family transcriptional regulator